MYIFDYVANVAVKVKVKRVRDGTHGQILLRAVLCTYPTPSPTNWALYGVEPYKSDSGQFCLSYNHIKYELKHFFQLIFDHNYLYLYV